jgi:hypothetical protein
MNMRFLSRTVLVRAPISTGLSVPLEVCRRYSVKGSPCLDPLWSNHKSNLLAGRQERSAQSNSVPEIRATNWGQGANSSTGWTNPRPACPGSPIDY